MRCPFCKTENRDDLETCYSCEKDLSMLRLIVQKARAHFNRALEFAERDRNEEAIAELNNALELDRSHVNSLVVLGSLHAKMGNMDKAESCWKQALETDPRYQKVHQYLEKLDTGRRNLPIVRRQRFYILGLSIFLLVLAVSFASLFARNLRAPSAEQFQRAWDLFQKKDDAGALAILEKIPQKDTANATSGQAALLKNMIHMQEEQSLGMAKRYLDRYEFVLADKELDNLLSRNPSREVVQKALRLRARLAEASQGAVATALDLYREGRASEEATSNMLRIHEGVVGPKDEFLQLSKKTFTALTRNRKIQNAIDRFQKKEVSREELLEELNGLRKEFPDYTNLDRVISFYAAPDEQLYIESLEKALRSGDIRVATESANSLERLWDIIGKEDRQERMTAYRQRIEERRTERILSDVHAQYQKGDYEMTVQLIDLAMGRRIDATTSSTLQTILADTQPRLAAQRWQWMRNLDRSYIDARISAQEAEKTIRIYPQVSQNLSRTAYPNVDDDMLFYLAMSYRRINQTDKAREAFEQLKSKYPKSAFVRWVKYYENLDEKGKTAREKPNNG